MQESGQQEFYYNEEDIYMEDEEEIDMNSDNIIQSDFLGKTGNIKSYIQSHVLDKNHQTQNAQMFLQFKQQIENDEDQNQIEGDFENFEQEQISYEYQIQDELDLEGDELGEVSLGEQIIGIKVSLNFASQSNSKYFNKYDLFYHQSQSLQLLSTALTCSIHLRQPSYKRLHTFRKSPLLFQNFLIKYNAMQQLQSFKILLVIFFTFKETFNHFSSSRIFIHFIMRRLFLQAKNNQQNKLLPYIKIENLNQGISKKRFFDFQGSSAIKSYESDDFADSPVHQSNSQKQKIKQLADLEINKGEIEHDIGQHRFSQASNNQNQKKKVNIHNFKQNGGPNDYTELKTQGKGSLSIVNQDIKKSTEGYSNLSVNKIEKVKLQKQEILNYNNKNNDGKVKKVMNQEMEQMQNRLDDKIDGGQDDYSQEFIQINDYGLNQAQVQSKPLIYKKQAIQQMPLLPPEQQLNDIRTSQKVIETCTSENDIFGPNQEDLSESFSNNQNINQQDNQDQDRKDFEVIKLNEAQMSKEVIMRQISQKDLNLKPHERKIGQYIVGKTIGEGTFGKVKIGTHILTKAKVAVKILEKSKILDVADVERVSREIHILKIVQHPNVVQLYEIIETPKKLYLIMEFASGGELFDYIVKHQRVQEKEACKFFQQLLSGIEYVSRLNIVHRDLKPENLLLDFDKGIKIVDFGLSNTYKTGELLKTACGSPCYAAPEMIAGKKYNGTNVDIWSCGVILFALICGYLPFEDPNTSNLYKKILSADFQTPNYVSDDAKDLFHCILNTDPEKRYTIEQIRKHPWFNIVPCESNFKGIQVGVDPVPIDSGLLLRMQNEFKIEQNYARKCIQANKHNHVTASYYLLLKELIKKGEKSIADVRSPDYNPQLFILSSNNIRLEKMRDKLENASIYAKEDNNAEMDENEIEDFKGSQEKQNFNVDEDGQIIISSDEEQQSSKGQAKAEKLENNKQVCTKLNIQKNNQNESRITSARVKSIAYSKNEQKSTQPQKLRKIADGLQEFERYADRKKRLQTISDKQERELKIKEMNIQLSQNRTADEMLSNEGGYDFFKRGFSPIGGNDATIQDTISNDLGYNYQHSIDPNIQYTNHFVDQNEFGEMQRAHGDRDYSPGLSPHAMRVNAQRGPNEMQTQYGNFLYQKEAKQFPNQIINQPQPIQQLNLKQQKKIEVQKILKKVNNKMPQIDATNLNSKQMQKQLKQFYLQQKKMSNMNHNKDANEFQLQLQNQEALLKSLVINLNASQGSSGNSMIQQQNYASGSGKGIYNINGQNNFQKQVNLTINGPANNSQLSKMQQQNYQQKKISLIDNLPLKTNENQNSTIQTAFATLQLNNQTLQSNNQNFQNKKKNSQGAPAVQGFQSQINSNGIAIIDQSQLNNQNQKGKAGSHHQRFATTQYGTGNSVFNTISQNFGGKQGIGHVNILNESAQSAISANSPDGYIGVEMYNQRNTKFASKTQSSFLQGVAKNGSKLTNSKQQNSVRKQQHQQQGKNSMTQNVKAAGSGSLGQAQRHVGIFSPKNIPSSNLGFGFGASNLDTILTPQTQINKQTQLIMPGNPSHLFTIDTTSQGLTQPLVISSQNNIPNQTVELPHNNTIRNQRTMHSFVNKAGGAQSLKPQTLPRKSSQIQQKPKQQFHQIVAIPSSITNPGSAGGTGQACQKGISSGSQADQQRQTSNKRKMNNQKQAGTNKVQQNFAYQQQVFTNQLSDISMLPCNKGAKSQIGVVNNNINYYQNQINRQGDQLQYQVGKAQSQNTQKLIVKTKSESVGNSNDLQTIQAEIKNRNNLSKPPLGLLGTITNINDKSQINCSFTATQPVYPGGSGSIEKRLSNTATHQPQSSQKKIQKQRGNNAKNLKTSTKKIQDQNQVNISINQGIPTGYVGAIGSSLSAKNSNIFSPIMLANSRKTAINTGIGMHADAYVQMVENYNQANIQPSQQQLAQIHQEQLINLSRIQAQLQRKQNQRQQQAAAQMNMSSTSYQQPQSSQQQVGAVSMRNPNKYLNQNGNYISQIEETHSAVIHKMQRNAEQFAQSSSPQNLVSGIQTKKGSNLLNNSLLAQNCAPHTLLQNYHGTGYPPMGSQISNQPVSALISPHNVQFSPQATMYSNLNSHLQCFQQVQSPQQKNQQQNILNESQLKFSGNQNSNQRQNAGRSNGPAQKQDNPQNQQNRLKTPQIVTSDEVLNPQSLNLKNQLLTSTGVRVGNYNNISQIQDESYQKMIGNEGNGSMTSTNKQKQRSNNYLLNNNIKVQKENSQIKFYDQVTVSPAHKA